MQNYTKYRIFVLFDGQNMGEVLTLYGTTKKGEFGTLLGWTVLKINGEVYIIASAVEVIEYIIRWNRSYQDKIQWKSHVKFQLMIDKNQNSNNDSDYENLTFSHFIVPNVPEMKRIVTNLYLQRKSLTILGYSDDSSK